MIIQRRDCVVDRDPFVQHCRRIGKPAKIVQCGAEGALGQGAVERCTLLLRKLNQPLGQLMGLLEFASQEVAVPQAAQDREQLGRPAELFA